MSATFVSANQWPIFGNWLMVRKDGYRLVVLKDAQGLDCRSTRHVRIVEIKDSSDKGAKSIQKIYTDRVCTESSISQTETFSDEACRTNLEFTIPTLVDVQLFWLPKSARLYAILGKTEGDATIRAYEKEKVKAELSVQVAKVIKLPAAFHIVRHLPGGEKPLAPHSKTINRDSILTALAFANQHLRQAAILVEASSITNADVESDLGSTVDTRDDKNAGVVSIRAKASQSTLPNVFFVGQVINNSGTAGTTFDKRDVIMDDRGDVEGFARTLAHELAHTLGEDHFFLSDKEGLKKKVISKEGNVTKYKSPAPKNLMGFGEELGLNRKQIARMREKARAYIGSRR